MNLGSQTNSLMNHLQERSTLGQPKPTPGMGCTLLMWTDRDAATINEVTELKSKKVEFEISLTRDREIYDKVSDTSTYLPGTGPSKHFRNLRSTGQWIEFTCDENGKYGYRKGQGNGLRIGSRDSYRDPSF